MSNIYETDLTMPMKFDRNNLFILYLNPKESAKVVGAMDSASLGCERPSNVPHGQHSKLIKDVANLICKVAFYLFL